MQRIIGIPGIGPVWGIYLSRKASAKLALWQVRFVRFGSGKYCHMATNPRLYAGKCLIFAGCGVSH
ncbi:hypothetical protein CSC3H3_07525 [Thalassospira marina]|uniref:Uncharacterized protein n=1 Tax=Thalassospira marina TaxID=2048283 RepID=A0ABN5FCW9_9PROT|nr:hypothetical protein CSC3H3_07525 [Thalassospira marina]